MISSIMLRTYREIAVGIDPQPNNISVCVLKANLPSDTREPDPEDWFMVVLMQRAVFPSAEDWQKYIWKQCTEICKGLVKKYPKCHVYVEQQRGRINSMIEQSLLGACMTNNLEVTTVHPKRWKSDHNFEKGTNANHKNQAEYKIKPSLEKYCRKYGKPLPIRVHDLCDAYLISESGLIRQLSKL